jgi:hypothetical protein
VHYDWGWRPYVSSAQRRLLGLRKIDAPCHAALLATRDGPGGLWKFSFVSTCPNLICILRPRHRQQEN